MRLLVCGSRHWKDFARIKEEIEKRNPEVVIEGDCRGADRIAGQAARELGIPVEEYPAKWGTYGRLAGRIRNQEMLDEGKPTHVLAFHASLSTSTGTRDMVARARISMLQVEIVSH